MNSHCLPELAVESLEPICSDGIPSAMSSGTAIASESSPRELLTDSSQAPPSSETFVSSFSPVQLANIEDLRTWLARVSRASHSAPLESNAVLTTNGICGQPPGTLFATWNPTKSNWKTCQESLFTDTEQSSSVILPEWVSWDAQELFQQPTPKHITYANVGGYVPTRANDALKRRAVNPDDPRNGLVGYVRRWPTPNVAMHKGSSAGAMTRISGKSRENDRLDYAVERGEGNGRLNPAWVEWLMGWPIGWTELKPLATDKFQEWLQQHGNY